MPPLAPSAVERDDRPTGARGENSSSGEENLARDPAA
jgi:hypothetical protein